MALSTFTASLPGVDAYKIAIQRFADEIADWSPFWDEYFKEAWFRHVQVHYETQGASTGASWAPLSERYAVWKQRHWPGLPIGVLSGALRESLTFQNDPNAVWEAGPTSLSVGTQVPYAMFLQRGTGRMPARPPLRMSQEFILLMGKLMQEYAVKTLRATGLSA